MLGCWQLQYQSSVGGDVDDDDDDDDRCHVTISPTDPVRAIEGCRYECSHRAIDHIVPGARASETSPKCVAPHSPTSKLALVADATNAWTTVFAGFAFTTDNLTNIINFLVALVAGLLLVYESGWLVSHYHLLVY
jgi:hypothetical protein